MIGKVQSLCLSLPRLLVARELTSSDKVRVNQSASVANALIGTVYAAISCRMVTRHGGERGKAAPGLALISIRCHL